MFYHLKEIKREKYTKINKEKRTKRQRKNKERTKKEMKKKLLKANQKSYRMREKLKVDEHSLYQSSDRRKFKRKN